MATKTISLEPDAYKKLRQAKTGESFTEVVRRAVWLDTPATGVMLLDYYRKGGSGVSERYLDAVAAVSGRLIGRPFPFCTDRRTK
jgi:Putative antitoxin